MAITRWIAALAVAALSAGETRFDHKVRDGFFAGMMGDRQALAVSMKTAEDVLAANPGHAEALVWHGSGLITESRYAFESGNTEKGMDLWRRGLEEMDRAVELAPKHVGVRIPRGAVLFGLATHAPPPMTAGFVDKALGDYEAVLAVQKDELDTLGTHPRGELLSGLALGYDLKGDREKAKLYFERIAAGLPGTAYSARARKWLDGGTLVRSERNCIGCHVSGK